jgi:hypothetical protein
MTSATAASRSTSGTGPKLAVTGNEHHLDVGFVVDGRIEAVAAIDGEV